jgi:molecular chaperone DnaK
MFVDRPVGIDLGTTNSEIALLHPSEKDLIIYADRFGRKTIPSAVVWDPKTEKLLVGHTARARRGKTPAPVESIKRKMGQSTRVELGPSALLPEEISAKILGELKERMREHLAAQAQDGVEMRVARAVVTVPAYFDAPQVEATRKAGELAGLDVIGILQEPTAAAIYHTWKNRLGDGNFLVYDLGGGTFDVSVLRCVGGEYQVLAIDGDNYLGGDDFDRRYAEHLRGELVKRGYALDLDVRGDDEDRARFGRIVHLAQEIKESLSTTDVVHVSKQEVVVDKQGEMVSYEADVGRDEYDKIVASLVDTTIACCERAIARAREVAQVGIEQIDHVVLVGGSTRVPLVVKRVTEAICKRSRADKPLQDDVDTCVALGAAIHAAQLGGLRLGDDATTIAITTPLVAHAAKIKLGVRVERAPAGAREIVVKDGDTALAQAPLDSVPSAVSKIEVALGPSEENRVTAVILGEGGTPLGEIPFALYRGDVRPRASALSRPSVVAKDIALEVIRAGRRERKVLLARGTGLPTSVTHRFFTVDQSGAVVLRILQNRMPIKTLVVDVDKALAVGTPVELTITCDEAMRMEARAVIAGQELWAQVEPPEQARFDPRGSIEALLEEADNAGKALWGSYGAAYRKEADVLAVGIREVAGTDPDKLEALCQRLRLLIDEFRGGATEEMVPPMHRFEETLDSLRRVVYRAASGALVGMDRNEWDTRIQEIEDRARAAYESGDSSGWRRAYNEVQALLETAHQEEFAAMRLDDPAYLSRRVANIIAWSNRVERSLSDYVPAQADEVKAMQIAEQKRLADWLREKAVQPLAEVENAPPTSDASDLRRKLDKVATELERIEAAVERIPSIGLVTDRGAT